MFRLIGSAVLRAVVVSALSYISYRIFVHFAFGNDPSADADIGGGLVPLAVLVILPFGWALVDARRGERRTVAWRWVLVAVLIAIGMLIRAGGEGASTTIALGVVFALIVAIPALIGCGIGSAQTRRSRTQV